MADVVRFEPIADAVHLVIDMQSLFARGGIWETPWMERVLPTIVGITARYTARTVFTRFRTLVHADDRPGRWRRYFGKMECATRARLPSSQLAQVTMLPGLRRPRGASRGPLGLRA